ncbi:molybdate ABC transporter substrate-binding protein [Gallaecimonas mangrovi]|uniref:molybdate ABC transporter substrate-binding protein n=1 Tax=Gallaecimonas mangrovi TaxID=2291597 RepID=UPI000E209274|nr:molybdate ABC transporter substrate-binding protein [Gallaecimonas mangrovi]
MTIFKKLLAASALLLLTQFAYGQTVTVATAASVRYAMDELAADFHQQYPKWQLRVVYGSSGKLTAQIQNGAPFDLFYAADMHWPQLLEKGGFAATKTQPYAVGRLVLWHPGSTQPIALDDLASASVHRLAIAQPSHAPYGLRAQQVLQAKGLWQKVQSKLVFGENIGQTAQMVKSGAAQMGLVALSLVKTPDVDPKTYQLVDASLHQPLVQGFIVTKQGEKNAGAKLFVTFMHSPKAAKVLEKHGFQTPN